MPIGSCISCNFSIIIPAYNASEYIGKCIESILSQTYKDFEVIVVNDGSEDKTADLVNGYVKSDSRVRLINQHNAGPGNARNNGVDNAVGRWVMFMDADDFWADPDCLSVIFAEIEGNPVDILNFNYFYINTFTGKKRKIMVYPDSIIGKISAEKCIKSLIRSGTFPMSPCTKVINRGFLKRGNIRFPENTYSEDIPWFIDMICASHNVSFYNWYFYAYRKDDFLSRSSKYSERKYTDLFDIFRNGVEDAVKGKPQLLDFWAYELCILMGMAHFSDMDGRNSKLNALRKYSWLLKYNQNPKVRLAELAYRVFGFYFTSRLLHVQTKKTISK